ADRTRRRGAARLLVLVATLAHLVAGEGPAHALPPDGPGPETPGTGSRVWPTTLRAGETLNFEVTGYPANETVYIKIDDGLMCSDTSHGACVYHTQRLDSRGHATGSLVLPANLAPGDHWLRMLATGDVFDQVTGQKIGYEGYTRRGGNDFTVVAADGSTGAPAGSGSNGGGATGGAGGGSAADGGATAPAADGNAPAVDGGATGSGQVGTDGSVAGGSLTVDAGTDANSMDDVTFNAADEEEAAPARNVPGAAERIVPAGAEGGDGGIPAGGVAVLVAAVVAGLGLLGWSWRRRSRVATEARTVAATAE
ncbi:MAG: hypothetical protein AB7L84_14835, partial [Acidimicrobiia bacterium]